MRITIMCPSHSLGDERVVCRQALALAQAGHEVLVLGRHDPEKSPPQHPRLRLEAVGPMTRGASWRARLAKFQALHACWRRARSSAPDLLAAHEPETALWGLLISRQLKIPIHFDVHECFDELLAGRVPPVLSNWVKRLSWRALAWIARRCDYVTVVSPATQRQYQAVRADRRVDIIHNSPPIELFPPCTQTPAGPLTVCHEGWLDLLRGMRQLLQALALAEKQIPLRLLVVGKLGGNCAPLFNALVNELGIGACVTVTGWLPYAEVGKVDATAQIGVVTLQPTGNNNGSLSNKVYSYMACGQALIVPRDSATAELVAQHECGLAVDVTKPEEIARAMVRLANDPALRQTMGRNGRQAIERHLGWHVMSARLISAYGDLLAGKRLLREDRP